MFTIPAFVLSGVWPAFDLANGYWKSVALMAVGGTLGILFVTLLRRVMVEDPDLPFPESVAAAEIHKAGQQGAQGRQDSVRQHGNRRGGLLPGRDQRFRRQPGLPACNVGELGTSVVKLTRMPGAPRCRRAR